MDIKWENILVEWVNCLNLARPIQNLEDLRDGIFFTNLQKVLTKSTELSKDTLTCLFEILNQHYPNVIINNKNTIHLEDVPYEDLKCITSLLLHYSCIYDGRNVLTSPLCYNLMQSTQLSIKEYLENISKSVTNDLLHKITSTVTKEGVANNVLSVAKTPNSKRSPLQDMFKTPVSKYERLQEKDKVIAKLKSHLELERYEKQDFLDEVRTQSEKIKKLENQLAQKNSEIQRLRSEVAALENRTPPFYQDKDARETQKRLRIELESLEQYVQQCDKENEFLIKEKDETREKNRKLESECNIWQQKFLEIEEKFQQLTDQSKDQEKKIEYFQNHCKELEALLDELKHSQNESYIEESFQINGNNRRSWNFQPLQSCEDLAHSVVDVQLREAQAKLEETIVYLDKVKKEKSNICREKEMLIEQVKEVSEKYDKSIIKLNETENKLENTIKERNTLFSEFEDIKTKLVQESQTVLITTELLEKTSCKLKEANACLDAKISQISNLTIRLDEETSEKNRVNNEYQITSNELGRVTIELIDTKDQLKIVTDEKNRFYNELAIAAEQLREAEVNLENVCSELDNLNKNCTLLEEAQAKALTLINNAQMEKDELCNKIEELYNEKQRLISQLNDSSVKFALLVAEKNILTKEIENQNEEKLRILKELETLKENLQTTEKQLQTTVDEKLLFLKKLEITSADLSDVFQQKERLSEMLVEIKDKFEIKNKEKEFLEKETYNLSKQLDNISAENIYNIKCLEDASAKISNIISERDQFYEKLRKLENNNNLQRKENENTKKEFRETVAKVEEACEENKLLCNKLEKTLFELDGYSSTNERLNAQINELQTTLKIIFSEKEELTMVLDNTLQDTNKLTIKSEELSACLQEALYNLEKVSSEKQKIYKELEKCKLSLNQVTDKLYQVSLEKQQLQQDWEKNVNELDDAKQQLLFASTKEDELLSKNHYLEQQQNNLTTDLENLRKERNNLFREISKLEENVVNTDMKLSRSLSEINTLKDELQISRQTVNEIKIDKQNIIEQLQTSNKDRDTAQNLLNLEHKEKCTLLAKIDELVVNLKVNTYEINESLEEKNRFLKLYEETKIELSETLKKLENTSKHLVKTQEELESSYFEKNKLKECINEISENVKLSNVKFETLTQEKENLVSRIEKLSADLNKVTFENENKNRLLLEKDMLQGQITTKVFELEKQLEGVQSEKDAEHSHLSKKLLEVMDELQKVKEEKQVVSNFLELNNNELEKLCHEKERILEALELSNKEVERLTKELDSVLENRNELSNLLEKIDEEKEIISQQLNDKILVIEETTSKYDKILIEQDEMLKIIEDTKQEKEQLSDNLSKVTTEKNILKDNLERILQEKQEILKENEKLLFSLELGKNEIHKIKSERNKILSSQTEIMKEMEQNIQRAHQNSIDVKNELLRQIEVAEKERDDVKNQLSKLRECYSNVVTNNSKFELETVTLHKLIEEKNSELAQYSQIKDAYEKLIEENNKYMTELDTVKYKRSRDRDEFVNLLKKEREESETRQLRKLKEVRAEYEEKLEKMKDKMLKLYREEINKEMQKVKTEQGESIYLQKIIDDLRNELYDAEQKINLLEAERDMLRVKNEQVLMQMSRESMKSITSQKSNKINNDFMKSSLSLQSNTVKESDKFITPRESITRKANSMAAINNRDRGQDRRNRTLSKQDYVEETITISRRTSINSNVVPPNLVEMEDEEDTFNTKYLTDLKEGRCTLPMTGRLSNISRISELAWRNSMVPAHLKSSYPAEVQFISPSRFKEDDIKTGNVELDDSLSKLLPGEKLRHRKDFGTTTYKKPGPPTPSKNGGRLSLQGNEIQPLREANSDKTPKKVTTPSRIKALFTGKNISTSQRENTENLTPRTKRMSIFRRQR